MSRYEGRIEIADRLKAGLVGLVKPENVYAGQVGDFQKARAVVVVSSGGSLPTIIARQRAAITDYINVDVFVLYADPESAWDEEQAETLLDQIVLKIAEIMIDNPTGNNWEQLSWSERSETGSASIGGNEYRREQVPLSIS